jgi:hypothetical protein
VATRQEFCQATVAHSPFLAETETSIRRQVLLWPAFLAAGMLAIGATTATVAGIDISSLYLGYITSVFAFTCFSVFIYVFLAFARLAKVLADNPIKLVWEDIRTKAPLLLLPSLIFPLFLTGFTAAKTAIPFLVGFHWDAYWADSDVLIFGDDAWRIAHRLLGTKNIILWECLYSMTWAGTLLLFKANVVLYAKPRRIGTIYLAMLLTWIIGGWLIAYMLSATGPVFAHLVDPDLTQRFAPLRSILDGALSPDSSTKLTQAYLAQMLDHPLAVRGGGISAMPSMHVGAVSIYVLSARGTKWLGPAIAFWIIIFLLSAYFGYHYWVDGIVAAAVAWGCWILAETCFRDRSSSSRG